MTTISWLLVTATQVTAIPDDIVLEFTADWCVACQQNEPHRVSDAAERLSDS